VARPGGKPVCRRASSLSGWPARGGQGDSRPPARGDGAHLPSGSAFVGASSPLHRHENCEHFYFIIEGTGEVETPQGRREVPPGTMVFIPALAEHRLRAVKSPLFYFESRRRTASRQKSSTARPTI